MAERTSAGDLPRRGTVAELFAGVGGFRLGLEGAPRSLANWPGCSGSGWRVVWSNQWEPGARKQHASDCYTHWYGRENHENRDLRLVLDDYERGATDIPHHDLLVGGFPCQDYSVAKSLAQARGMQGEKGALWWQIHRLLTLQKMRAKLPRFLFLENVDRLLNSPADQRGRDFAVILASLNDLGYLVEWRVINAADYGFPQRRRRVLLLAHQWTDIDKEMFTPSVWMLKAGALARAFGAEEPESSTVWDDATPDVRLGDKPLDLVGAALTSKRSPFKNAGVAIGRRCWTRNVRAVPQPTVPLRDVLVKGRVPQRFYVSPADLPRWERLKSRKSEERTSPTGFEYRFSEGSIAFPDSLDRPARTITTGEVGASPSRFRHVIRTSSGRLRRLTPTELERLNGFPDGWTSSMPDSKRGFMMGNAIVVGLVQAVGNELRKDLEERYG